MLRFNTNALGQPGHGQLNGLARVWTSWCCTNFSPVLQKSDHTLPPVRLSRWRQTKCLGRWEKQCFRVKIKRERWLLLLWWVPPSQLRHHDHTALSHVYASLIYRFKSPSSFFCFLYRSCNHLFVVVCPEDPISPCDNVLSILWQTTIERWLRDRYKMQKNNDDDMEI